MLRDDGGVGHSRIGPQSRHQSLERAARRLRDTPQARSCAILRRERGNRLNRGARGMTRVRREFLRQRRRREDQQRPPFPARPTRTTLHHARRAPVESRRGSDRTAEAAGLTPAIIEVVWPVCIVPTVAPSWRRTIERSPATAALDAVTRPRCAHFGPRQWGRRRHRQRHVVDVYAGQLSIDRRTHTLRSSAPPRVPRPASKLRGEAISSTSDRDPPAVAPLFTRT